ncbi:MAG: hypothetical protein RDV48_04555 [Candidatus Eremiobacteraeota bacterium]|nr:hypothetical protein [Candidatus Eremiobacteraeota bacterium]
MIEMKGDRIMIKEPTAKSSVITMETARTPRIEDGSYQATVAEVRIERDAESPLGMRDQVSIFFLVGPSQVKLRTVKPLSLDPTSPLYQTILGITGERACNEYDLEKMVGHTVEVLVRHRDGWEFIENIRFKRH